MTFQKQEQITKKNAELLLSELINYNGENLIGEIVRLGIQNLMDLERDEHIGVGSYDSRKNRPGHHQFVRTHYLDFFLRHETGLDEIVAFALLYRNPIILIPPSGEK